VVDGSDADPLAQLATVREVLREIGAGDVPELVVVNKSDAADPIAVEAVTLRERGSVVVSAQTGAGIEDLLAALEGGLPRHDREVCTVVPYERGDLLARAHEEGEVLDLRHGADGTLLQARVPMSLAAELDRVAKTVPGREASKSPDGTGITHSDSDRRISRIPNER
jgi:GTPase